MRLPQIADPSRRGWSWLAIVVAALVLFGFSNRGYCAQNAHDRRFAAELAVIEGDLRILQQGGLTQRHQRGLVDRISSALGFLGLLAREAQQASARPDADLHRDIEQLRQDFLARDIPAVVLTLKRIRGVYRLDTRGFLPVESTQARLERGREIYNGTCRACHIAPDSARDNPARNLFNDAVTMPEEEFLARLFAGIRGVPETGLENPYSDEDLRSLLAWFYQGDPAVERTETPAVE